MIPCNSTVNLSQAIDCNPAAAGATIFSPVIMFLAGVLGNILALCQLCSTRIDVRTTNFYSLVTGLVWTDLLGILLTSPSVIIAYVNGRQWFGGEMHCRFHGFAMVCFGIATPFIICAMAVERFIAVKCVFFYSSKCRSSTASCWVLLIWFVVILYGLLPLIGFGKFVTQHPGTWCYLDFHSDILSSKLYAYFYAFIILSLTVIICGCNTYVAITIFKTRQLRKTDRHTSKGAIPNACGERSNASRMAKSNDMDVQMIVLMCAITLVFTVCWTPLMVQIIVTMVTGKTNHIMDLTAVRLASLNQTLDPWLYILFSRSFCSKMCFRFTHMITGCLPNSNAERATLDFRRQYKPVNAIKLNVQRNTNDNKTIEQHSEGYDNNVQIGSVPDVMSRLPDCNRSPLPDVTHTNSNNRPGYLCRLQFGKSSLPEKEGGIFVRIFYPPTSICTHTLGLCTNNTNECSSETHGRFHTTGNKFTATSHSDNTYTYRKIDNHSCLRKTKSNS